MDGNNTLTLGPQNGRGSGSIEHNILGLGKDKGYSVHTTFFVKLLGEKSYIHTFSKSITIRLAITICMH